MENYDKELEFLIDKLLDNPRDFFIKVYYSLCILDREQLAKEYTDKRCSNCSNTICRIAYSDKRGSDEGCTVWQNPELLGRKRVLSKTQL